MPHKSGEPLVNKRLGYMLGLALATSVAGSTGTKAMSINAWHDLLELLPDLKQVFDAAPGLIANDLPSLVSADNDLQETLNHARKFHSEHEFKESEPKLDGDRAFSKDPAIRKAMRDEYAGFVHDEAHDIDMLTARRAEQANHLADYQRLLDRNVNFANKAPDLIGRAAAVSDEMAQELAGILLTTQQTIPLAQELVDQYKRILREYDEKILREQAAHAAHVSTLGIVDAIQPKQQPAGQGDADVTPLPALKGRDVATGGGRATSGDRIHAAVNGATAGVEAHASQSQTRLAAEQRQMGPKRPMPSQQGSSVPTQQAPPDFTGTMTMTPEH